MGIIAGTIWPLNGAGEEKNWRNYTSLTGYHELLAFLQSIEAEDRCAKEGSNRKDGVS
jgi:hypothetical protein